MSKKGIIVNEWEKLNRISNRRLNVQNLNTPLKLQWSIDRITIVGKLKENIYYHTPNDVLILNFEQLMQLNEGNGFVKSVGKNGWQIVDQYEENIAYIELLQFHEGKARLILIPIKLVSF